MKTAVVEKDVVGGRCLNYACIPAKAVLANGADILTEIREVGEFRPEGEASRRSTSVPSASGRKKVIKTLTGGVSGLFKKNKIDLHRGARGADR